MYVHVSVYKEKSRKPRRRSSTLLTNRRKKTEQLSDGTLE